MNKTLKKPKVSVIIPCYNYGLYLKEAVNSVKKQTFRDWECLIIDDGSTDSTKKIAKSFCQKDKRIKYFYQNNKGLSSARNLGIKKSSGELIAFLDADDVWYPEKLKEQVRLLDKKQNIGLCCAFYEIIDQSSTLIEQWEQIKIRKKYRQRINLKLLCQENYVTGPSSVMVRRGCFVKSGYFDEKLKSVEDHDMWLRISLKYRIFCLPRVLVKIRMHENNMQKNLATMHIATLQFIKKAKRIVPQEYLVYLNRFERRIQRDINTRKALSFLKKKQYHQLVFFVLKSFFLHPLRAISQTYWCLKNRKLLYNRDLLR